MLFFTPNERRAVIFVLVVFFCGLALDIFFKLSPSVHQQLNVLDRPPERPKTDINRATYEELLLVPGLGPATAARIIHARQDKGRFASVDELRGIKKISKKTFARAAAYLTAGAP